MSWTYFYEIWDNELSVHFFLHMIRMWVSKIKKMSCSGMTTSQKTHLQVFYGCWYQTHKQTLTGRFNSCLLGECGFARCFFRSHVHVFRACASCRDNPILFISSTSPHRAALQNRQTSDSMFKLFYTSFNTFQGIKTRGLAVMEWQLTSWQQLHNCTRSCVWKVVQ